jgi:Uma2 family endonuclease
MSVVSTRSSKQPFNSGRFQWTVDAFYRATDAGVFDEPKQWELVNGELWQKEAMNPPHAELTESVAERLRTAFLLRFKVREEKPIHLTPSSEPVSDVSVVVVRNVGYGISHPIPEDIRLLIEVADASVSRDTGEKALLYARAGIVEYWVSVIPARELVVFRNPTPDGYAPMTRLRDGEVISPLSAPDIEFSVRDLIARAIPENV